MPGSGKESLIWLIPLLEIEEIVSAHLGPGRIRSNAAGPCLSRQVSMYLAKRVGGWSLPKIGRFYNGRHHTTVLHAIAKVERLRKADQAFDALLDVLTATLASEGEKHGADKIVSPPRRDLIDAVASCVIQRLKEMPITGTAHLATGKKAEISISGTSSI